MFLPKETRALQPSQLLLLQRPPELEHQSRLADARLPRDENHLPLPLLHPLEIAAQDAQPMLPPHQRGQATRARGLDARGQPFAPTAR